MICIGGPWWGRDLEATKTFVLMPEDKKIFNQVNVYNGTYFRRRMALDGVAYDFWLWGSFPVFLAERFVNGFLYCFGLVR